MSKIVMMTAKYRKQTSKHTEVIYINFAFEVTWRDVSLIKYGHLYVV